MPDISNLMLWLLQGGSGAVAGYLTNKYAVNMLFKEYTPFKIGKKVIIPYKMGGVIKNSKEKFIEEISSLVERDIINGNTLKGEISRDEFKKEIEKLSSLFFNEELAQAFGSMKFKELSEFDDSIESIKNFTKDNVENVSYDLINNFIDKFNITDIMTSEQISNISSCIYETVLSELLQNDELSSLVPHIYDEQNEITIDKVLSENAKTAILGNIKTNINSIIEKVWDDEDKIKDILNNICRIAETDKIIEKFQSSLKEKTIGEIISSEECSIISQKLFDNINIYIKSENGRRLTENYASQIIEMAECMDFTIYDLLPQEMGHKLSDVINENLPKLLPYLSEWITRNKDEFDNIIENSIDEALENMDNSIKSLIISKVRTFFLNDISAKNKVIEKIVEYIENYEMTDESLEELSGKIVTFLRNTKIKDMVSYLKDKNILNEDIINKIGNFIGNIFSKYGKNIIEKFLNAQCSKKIDVFLKVDFIKVFNNFGKEKILQYIISNKEVLLTKSKELTDKVVNSAYSSLCRKNIKDLIPREETVKIGMKCPEYFNNLLTNNKESIIEKLNNEILSGIESLNLKLSFENNKDSIKKYLVDMVLDFESRSIENYQETEISSFISNIGGKEEAAGFVKDEIYKYLNDNLENLLQGNVKKVIYDNLIQFNEDEICDLAQKFMGNELKPLSIFGGMLGLIVGLLFGLFMNNINLTGFYGSFGSTISSMIAMGAIGVATNVIAITMLFKPYKKNKLLAKIPFLRYFALGYIPAHKENLSKSIGNVIDNELLNDEHIKSLFSLNRDKIQKSIVNTFEKSNYKALINFLNNKKDQISINLYSFILKLIKLNNNNLTKLCGNLKLSYFMKNIDLDKIVQKLSGSLSSLEENLSSYIENKINSEKRLCDIIPEAIVLKGEKALEIEVDKFITENSHRFLSEENLKKVILNCNDIYAGFTNKSLSEALGKETTDNIKLITKTKITEFIFNDLRYIVECKVKEFLSKEIDGDKTIKDAFNGNMSSFIDNNINQLGGILINKASELLINNEDTISTIVKAKVNESLNFFEKLGYAMAGGDSIVESCVDILVRKKIPEFMNVKFDEISILIKNGLDNTIYPMKIADLKLKSSEMNTGAVLNNAFEMLLRNNRVKEEIENGTDLFIDLALNTKINSILELIGLGTVESVYERFENEISILREESLNRLQVNTSSLAAYICTIINELSKEFMIVRVCDLTYNIEKQDIQHTSDFILDTLKSSSVVKCALMNTLQNVYTNLNTKKISDVLDLTQLENSLTKAMIMLSINPEFNNTNVEIVRTIINNCIDNEFNFINNESKHDIAERISSAVISSSIKQCSSILNSINLKEVTYVQINLMESKEIHELFNSFAGDYFNKLYLYGAYGAFFGINVWLPLIWIPIDMIIDRHDNNEEVLQHN